MPKSSKNVRVHPDAIMTDSVVDLVNFANQREDRTAILVICDPDGKKTTYRVTVQKGLPLRSATNSKLNDI